MMNKWLLRFGSLALTLTLITGCATNNNNEDNGPIDETPLDQNQDIQDNNNGNNQDNNGNNQNNGDNLDNNNNNEDNGNMIDRNETDKDNTNNR